MKLVLAISSIAFKYLSISVMNGGKTISSVLSLIFLLSYKINNSYFSSDWISNKSSIDNFPEYKSLKLIECLFFNIFTAPFKYT